MTKETEKVSSEILDTTKADVIDKRYLSGYYNQSVIYRHPVYGKGYGDLNKLKEDTSKVILEVYWDKFPNLSRFQKELDQSPQILESRVWSEERVMYSLEHWQQNRNSVRHIIQNNTFDTIIIKGDVDYIAKKLYYFTANSLIHGSKVIWDLKTIKATFEPVAFIPNEIDRVFDTDFYTWNDKKIPYPSIQALQYPTNPGFASSPKRKKATLDMKEEMAEKGFVLSKALMEEDKPYWNFEITGSWRRWLDYKLPLQLRGPLVNGKSLESWAYYMTLWFRQNILKMYPDDKGITQLRAHLRTERWEEMARLNPTISSWTEVSRNYPTWFTRNLTDPAKTLEALFVALGSKEEALKLSEQFYGPSFIRYLDSAPNQGGFRTERTYRDYVEGSKGKFQTNVMSFRKSKETEYWNKTEYLRNDILYIAECDKLLQINYILNKGLTKEFLADGYKLCKKCNEVYKMSQQELVDSMHMEDSEYTLYGESTSLNESVISVDNTVQIGLYTENRDRHPLEEHFCDKCRSNVTLDDLLCVVSEDVRLAAKKLLDKGIAPESMYKALLQEL